MIGGGPCAYNPEPLAEFFDLFYIGEGETVYDELLDLYKQCMCEKSIKIQAATLFSELLPVFRWKARVKNSVMSISGRRISGVPPRSER